MDLIRLYKWRLMRSLIRPICGHELNLLRVIGIGSVSSSKTRWIRYKG